MSRRPLPHHGHADHSHHCANPTQKVPLFNEHNVGFSQTFANLLLPTLPDDHGIVLLNTGVGGTVGWRTSPHLNAIIPFISSHIHTPILSLSPTVDYIVFTGFRPRRMGGARRTAHKEFDRSGAQSLGRTAVGTRG